MIDQFARKFLSVQEVALSLLVLLLLTWILYFLLEKLDFFMKAAAIPSAKTGPFSIAGDIIFKPVDECLQTMLSYFKTGPEVFKGWLGVLLVGISKPEHIETVFTNTDCLNKSKFIEFTKIYMGEGLFSARVEIWKKNRKLITPTFNQRILNSFIPIFQEKTEILIGILEEKVGQPDIDIVTLMSRCTLDTICESAIGLRVDAQTTASRYAALLDRIMEITTARILNVIYHVDIIFENCKLGKEAYLILAEMNDFSRRVIKERKAIFEQKKIHEFVGGEEGQKTFLELLLEISDKGDHFNDQQLLDEVNTFISAGSDSSAVTISFCFLTMGLFPDCQEKLYEEAIEVLGADRMATKEDLPKLKYTEMFIKETLRLFPIAPVLLRTASADIKLDDVVVPKNAVFLIGIMHLHRSPKYWDDPMKFNPYRFLPEAWAQKHPYSHLPFAGGLRSCIGRRYAMMVMKLILSKIVRSFKVKTDYKSIEEVELKMNLMMRPRNGYKVSLEARESKTY